MIDFIFPAWLLLLIPFGFAWYFLRTSDWFHNALSAIFMVLVILALSQPRINIMKRGGTVVVVADRSSSLPPDSKKRQDEIIRLLEKEKGLHDRIAVVGFAEDIYVEQLPEGGTFDEFKGFYAGNASVLSSAIETAKSIIPHDCNGRMLLLTDGRFTSSSPLNLPLGRGVNVPIDYRMMQRPTGKDLAVASIDMPESIETGEAFQFSADILVPESCEVAYTLSRENVIISQGKTVFAAGRRSLVFNDRLVKPGNTRYHLETVSKFKDSYPENNNADAVVTVHGPRPLLHVGKGNSRLINLGNEGHLNIKHSEAKDTDWTLDGLSRFKGIVLENVSAMEIGFNGQDALKHFVSDLGGGLMITGGRKSFGIGGYFKTPLADIMPVSMELRREHRKLSTAVVVALDRSGSMSMTVPGGLAKMDLANQGTASVLELLSDNDSFGVVAVDSQAHIIVQAGKISGNKDEMARRIRSIKSMGGGIFIYEALFHASKQLSGIEAGTRHIILFADSSDSEEPGNYRELVSKLKADGISVSVIGLGTDKDVDANLLKEIASLGGGNIYFTDSAKELPQLFAQETISVFRGAFIEEKTPMKLTSDFPLVSSIPEGVPPPLGGYNLSYLKPGASVGMITEDEYKAPVLAFWQKDTGRCLAFTGEADGKFTGEFGQWKDSGQILLSCLRWINTSSDDDDNYFIRPEKSGSDMNVFIELDPERKTDPFKNIPRLIHLKETKDGITKEMVPFEWRGKDTLGCSAPITPSGTSHFYVEADSGSVGQDLAPQKKIIQVCSQCLPYMPEFAPETNPERGRKTLARLAVMTGGEERLSLDGIFSSIEPFRKFIPLWHFLALAALIMLVLEVAYRRTSLNTTLRNLSIGAYATRIKEGIAGKNAAHKKAAFPAKAKVESEKAKKAPIEKAPEPESSSMLGALSQAKRKSRERTDK